METQLRDLEIVHQCRAILRLCTGAAQSQDCLNLVRNLKIGKQFPDSKNALRNLEIAQIPRLRGTNTQSCGVGPAFLAAGSSSLAILA